MEHIQLGKTKEKVSVIGLGTWHYGKNEVQEINSLHTGFKLGIDFVDTAEIYGTEDIAGKAIEGRDDIFIATKVAPAHFHYEDVIKACNSSLKELGIRQIDLYQLHWPSNAVPIEETMRAMEKLVEDGKIRYIGVSNFSVREMQQAQNALKKNDIVSNQVEYSILVRDVEKELLGYCKKERVSIIAYSPLALGHLYDAKYAKLTSFLKEIGEKYKKTPTQVALNWLVTKGNVIPIPKASTKEHVEEIAGSAGWRLSKEDMDLLNSFLFKYRRMSLAGFAGPVIKNSMLLSKVISHFSGRRKKKKS